MAVLPERVVTPIARYMILCEGVGVDPIRPGCVVLDCVMSNIVSSEDPAYPLVRDSICVFMVLTDCRGNGVGQLRIVFVDDELEQPISRSPNYSLDFTGKSPLELVGTSFRMNLCRFPKPGNYLVQFWYNGIKVEEHPLRLK